MAEKPQEIEDLPGVGPSTAEKLREAGYLTIESVATTSPAELAEITEISEATAKKIIKAAREKADLDGFKTGKDIFEQRKNVTEDLVPRTRTGYPYGRRAGDSGDHRDVR